MPSVHELLAHDRTDEEIAQTIGADRLIYQDLKDLVEAARKGNMRIQRFDASCFNGEYVTGDVGPEYLEQLENRRNDANRCVTPAPGNVSELLDLYSNLMV